MPLDGIQIRQVTRIQTTCDIHCIQSAVCRLKKFRTEVHKLLKMYLSVAVTTASAERNFFCTEVNENFLKECNDTTASKSLHIAAYSSGQDRYCQPTCVQNIAKELVQKNKAIGY